MPDAVQISDLRLVPLDPDQITELMAESAQGWYTLLIVVKNGGTVPAFVMSSVRRIRYDESRRALAIELSDHNSDHSWDAGLPLPPAIEQIAPGGEGTIAYRMSSPITFMEESSAGQLRPRFVHVPQDVDTIDCTIAVDPAAPPQNVNLVSHELFQDLRGWGRTIERAVAVDKALGRPH